MPDAIFVAAFDSQIKWCAGILEAFRSAGFACRILVPDIRNALSESQLRAAGVAKVERVTWEQAIEAGLASDVAVSALSGPNTKRLVMDLAQSEAPRMPVIVSGWVGIIIEKLIAGYLDRSASDIVVVNSVEDLERFRAVADSLGLPKDNLLLAGLPFLPPVPAPEKSGPIRRVLFADQPTVPEDPAERRYVYERLIAYAQAHPEREVILKPRHRPGEDTFHRMRHHPEDLLCRVPRPPNFRIDYEPIPKLLESADLLLTISSTACLEAIGAGVRVALVLDLGVHERYGNQVFAHSGLLRTFNQIVDDDIGTPSDRWRDSYFFGAEHPANVAIVNRTCQLLASGERPSVAARQSQYFRSILEFEAAMTRLRIPSTYAGLLAAKHGPAKRAFLKLAHGLTPPLLQEPAKRLLRALGAL